MSSESHNNGLQEFTGRFVCRKFRNEDDSYCVCLYENTEKPGDVVTVVGANLPEVTFPVTFRGKTVYSQKFKNQQFKVEMIVNQLPETKADTETFISSLKVGIGRKRAGMMVDLVGMNRFWEELERDPLQFTSIQGITTSSLQSLLRETSALSSLQTLFRFFSGDLKMNGNQYSRIRSFFKDDLQTMVVSIKNNPFCLIECGYSFEELDYFCSRHTLFPLNDYRRLLAATQQALINAKGQSHVGLPRDVLQESIYRQLEQNGSVSEQDIESFLDSASQSGKIVFDKDLFYLPRAYKEEVEIATVLSRLASNLPRHISRRKFDSAMVKYAEKKGFSLSPDQEESVWTALTRCICVITGGPGTGKSTILDAILYCWKIFVDTNWLLMAPTGKAAVRMTETTTQPASTIHSQLRLIVGNESLSEIDEDIDTTESSLIIVDECSMLDQTVMASLVKALAAPASKPQHLIIVGDPNQLPSVGWGNVLADIISSGVIPVRRLQTIYRQGAGNPIITNSAKMQAGDVDLDWSNPIFHRYNYEDDVKNMEVACTLYRRSVKKYGIENVVLLSPYHSKTDISTNILNNRLQDAINPVKSPNMIRVSDRLTFREGDRVMQTVNTDSVSNGEVGTIQWIVPKASGSVPCMCVEYESGTKVEYLRDSLHQLDLAYAMSIHKSQGSQWKVVIIVLPVLTNKKSNTFLRRNLLYTGITRSSYAVALISPTATISYCITNDKQDMRYTNLVARLREMIPSETNVS